MERCQDRCIHTLADADDGDVAVLYTRLGKRLLFEICDNIGVVGQFAHFAHFVLIGIDDDDVRSRSGEFRCERRAEAPDTDDPVRHFIVF